MPLPQLPVPGSAVGFDALPDPGEARTLDDLVDRLLRLKAWAGDPSYECIKDRVNVAWTEAGRPAEELARKTTVVDCFRRGRRRLNTDLVVAVVRALHGDLGYVTQWRQALRVVDGETRAAAQVRVQDRLPQDLPGFTGRATELDRLRRALSDGRRAGDAVVISAIEGMAGVGKTQLAIHAAHRLAREDPFDRVFFVDLRGFHPDPTQPPADPAAVLDGFLRLLGEPAHRIPHDLAGRAAAYRDRLAGRRILVVLDNAADTDQVRPLLPATPGCAALVTSRRTLTGLPRAALVQVDVFPTDEALQFLARSVPQVRPGPDPLALNRIARRCGRLPLALGLVAGHIRGTPGWTLTDHADRLDERHRDGRLDTGVELALDLSYQHLPSGRRRLLRLAALHPGADLDAYAAAALTGTDLSTAQDDLLHLHRDHLLQQGTPGRYTFHDLVRAYATGRADDEDPPADRRSARTRLFDHYLATAAAAMDTLFPAEAHRRPRIPLPATLIPAVADPMSARTWLDTERPNLVAVATHTATHGWPTHTTRLSTTLFRYLNGGHLTDALTVDGHACHAAQRADDPTGHAHALTNLGGTHLLLGRFPPAAENLRMALDLFRCVGDRAGQARALSNLGVVEERLGRYESAVDHYERALTLCRQVDDRTVESRALGNLGFVEARLGRYDSAVDRYEQALVLCRRAGDRNVEAATLSDLAEVEVRLGRHGPAAEHLHQALALSRQLGDRASEAWTLHILGVLDGDLGRPARAIEHHRRALALFREISGRDGEARALNGLGECAHAAGRPAEALAHHTAAHTIALEIGALDQQARALAGRGHAHHALDDHPQARGEYERALALYTDVGLPQAEEVRALLHSLGDTAGRR